MLDSETAKEESKDNNDGKNHKLEFKDLQNEAIMIVGNYIKHLFTSINKRVQSIESGKSVTFFIWNANNEFDDIFGKYIGNANEWFDSSKVVPISKLSVLFVCVWIYFVFFVFEM